MAAKEKTETTEAPKVAKKSALLEKIDALDDVQAHELADKIRTASREVVSQPLLVKEVARYLEAL